MAKPPNSWNGRWPGSLLGFFDDPVSHLPGCCSYYALVLGTEGPYSNRSSPCGRIPPYSTFCPSEASLSETNDRERESPLITPPGITLQRCTCTSGPAVWNPTWARLGWQNERDREMVEDPLIGFEEVVSVIGSQGQSQDPRGYLGAVRSQFVAP